MKLEMDSINRINQVQWTQLTGATVVTSVFHFHSLSLQSGRKKLKLIE